MGKNSENTGETQEGVFGISLGTSLNMSFVGLGAGGAEREGSGRRKAVAEAWGGKKVVEDGMGQGGEKRQGGEQRRFEMGGKEVEGEGAREPRERRGSGWGMHKPALRARPALHARTASLKLCAQGRPCPPPCPGSLMKRCGAPNEDL